MADELSPLNRVRVVVLGYIVRGPIGGMAWHHLQYVLGLKRLGHEVLFLEDSDDYPSCYNPQKHVVDADPSYGLEFADRAFQRLGVADLWAYYDAHNSCWHGPGGSRAVEFCRNADLLINVSGVNTLRSWTKDIPRRVFIDTDPTFSQVRHLIDTAARQRAQQHNVFFSFGELIPTGESCVPDDRFPWQSTRQPVVMDLWKVTPAPASGRFTTVMQWDSYPAREFGGERFGLKSESFREVADLPKRVHVTLEIALGGSSAPRDDLKKRGWQLVDPLEITRDPWSYQQYLQQSTAEFGVAKHGYVTTNSGWFSERSACYMASARPVVVQDTGFSSFLPVGDGICPFHDLESAIAAIEDVVSRYSLHSSSAREIAVEYFDSDKVLDSLIERSLT